MRGAFPISGHSSGTEPNLWIGLMFQRRFCYIGVFSGRRVDKRLLSASGKLQVNGLGHYFAFYCEIHLFVNKFYLNAECSPSFLFRNEKDGN